ncbi:MAG: GNAT family N-acetyltransferase [Saprospiraceae bacterium]|nr:GNAT family N-acetyltransferase [Saprospiraceae bacterium]
MEIVKAGNSDISAILSLSSQMGYSLSGQTGYENLQRILQHPDHEIYLAWADGELAGYIHVCKMLRVTSKPFLEIIGLVVDNKQRRQGIGKLLVEKCRTQLKVPTVRVRTNAKRQDAIAFYESLGFERAKDQMVMVLE